MFALVALVLAAPLEWKQLAPGIEYATTAWTDEGLLYLVRIDPKKAELKVGLASENQAQSRTAGDWAEGLGFTVAINAGMFAKDQRSNVGYLRDGTHENNPSWNEYRSALGFGPAGAAMVDLDTDGAKKRLEAFPTAIQNLRLIKSPGVNVWKAQPRKWSEAAVAADAKGYIYFLFSRAPLTMKDFNDKLLALPLGITHAMHVEGGPEASLSIRAGDVRVDLCGSYESGFFETDDNKRQWNIPNVIGVSPRP